MYCVECDKAGIPAPWGNVYELCRETALKEYRSDRNFADTGHGSPLILNSPISGSAECRLGSESHRFKSGEGCNEGFRTFREKRSEFANSFGITNDVATQMKLSLIVTKQTRRTMAPRLVINPVSILHRISCFTNRFIRSNPSPRHPLR